MELVVLCADSAWWGLAGRLGYHVNTQPSAREYEERRAARDEDEPSLIVVAVPPDVTADVIERELATHPGVVVTDVASVKLEPLQQLQARGVDLTHYIGSHPLAGRERGGAIAARADIFVSPTSSEVPSTLLVAGLLAAATALVMYFRKSEA